MNLRRRDWNHLHRHQLPRPWDRALCHLSPKRKFELAEGKELGIDLMFSEFLHVLRDRDWGLMIMKN